MSDSMREAPESMRVRIVTPCPTCGSNSLFVGSGGHLTCAVIGCRNPSVQGSLERYKAIERVLAGLVDNACGYDKSLVRVATMALKNPEWFDLDYIRGELGVLEIEGRRLLASSTLESRQAAAAIDPVNGKSTS